MVNQYLQKKPLIQWVYFNWMSAWIWTRDKKSAITTMYSEVDYELWQPLSGFSNYCIRYLEVVYHSLLLEMLQDCVACPGPQMLHSPEAEWRIKLSTSDSAARNLTHWAIHKLVSISVLPFHNISDWLIKEHFSLHLIVRLGLGELNLAIIPTMLCT